MKKIILLFILLFAIISSMLLPVTGIPEPAEKDYHVIEAGYFCSFVIKADGSLWSWGNNWRGQLGNGEYDSSLVLPIKILDDVVSVSAQKEHTMAIKKDGSLWAWGYNGYGQIGDGTHDNKLTPVKIMDDVISVSVGEIHSLAIKKDGSLWAWGGNYGGQIGDGTCGGKTHKSTPVKIMEGVVSIAAGSAHSMAIKKDGSLWVWGGNSHGQLGYKSDILDNDYESTLELTPKKIMDGVVSIAANYFQSFAIKKDGSLWAFGYNWYGQIGDGTYGEDTEKYSPVKVLENVAQVYAGPNHTMAIKKDGSLWAWGYNGYGQIGDGTVEIRDAFIKSFKPNPTKIMENVVAVAGGSLHTIAIKKDGSLWAWGSNSDGELGDGTREERHFPIKIMSRMMFPPYYAPKVGDTIGEVLYSDIVAYINDEALPTSVIDGKTLVVVEDLAKYGFDVVWDNGDRSLRVELNKTKKINPLPVEKDTTNKPGIFKCKYLYTDIKTYLSGEVVESYAIAGVTLIDFELLAKYGKLSWNGKTREIRLVIE